jgi:hypothetical protein|tara:strand:+ start:95 stop:559 length:465 start_codon:yes stop_codon:yes gene_type:complete
MALSSKKYDTIHTKTGSDKDKLKDEFDNGYLTRISDIPDKEPALAALVYQVGLMQEELDYLRTEISSNKDKTTFPGFGTSSTTALAGDTTTISTAQASAITANTAKVSQGLNTASHTMQFDVVNSKGAYTLTITIIDSTNAKSPVTKTVTLNLK